MLGKKKINILEEELYRTKDYLKDARKMISALNEKLSEQLNRCLEEKQEIESNYESVISDLKNNHKNKENKLLAEIQKKEEEIKRLKNDLEKSPKLLSQIDLDNMRKEIGRNAWEGKESRIMFADTDGYPVLKLQGHMYEPSYECFNFTCTVVGYDSYGKEYILFDEDSVCIESYRNKKVTIGSEEKIRNYIREKDRYVLKMI